MPAEGEQNISSTVADFTGPGGALGCDTDEAASLTSRGSAGLVMALALIHHVAIGNNTGFDRLARFLATLGPNLLIEFVPPDDPMALGLVAMRNHEFPWYTQPEFESAFGRHFEIQRSSAIADSKRRLYLMTRRS